MSLHMDAILVTLENLHVEMEGKPAHFILLIQQKQFDELRFWISKELNIASNSEIINFYGSEFVFVTLMRNLNLINNRYNSSFQCSNCFGFGRTRVGRTRVGRTRVSRSRVGVPIPGCNRVRRVMRVLGEEEGF